MNPNNELEKDDEILPDYDFSKGERGKHHESYHAGTSVVLLEAEIARAFPVSA